MVIGHSVSGKSVVWQTIYSFHMPFFMLIAGMVFSLKFKRIPYRKINVPGEMMKSLRGLVIPYVIWTMIYSVTNHRTETAKYLLRVFTVSEGSLWFLIILFYCRMFFLFIHSSYTKISRNDSMIVFAAVVLLAYLPVLLLARIETRGSLLGIGAFRTHFPYFALGVFLCKFRERLSAFLCNIPLSIMMLILLAIVTPCFSTEVPNPVEVKLAEFSTRALILLKIIRRVSAIPGIFLMMSLTKLILHTDFRPLINALSFTGKKTLGIYAIHGYFGMLFPPVILPLSGSIIITVIIEKIPLIRSLLLGK